VDRLNDAGPRQAVHQQTLINTASLPREPTTCKPVLPELEPQGQHHLRGRHSRWGADRMVGQAPGMRPVGGPSSAGSSRAAPGAPSQRPGGCSPRRFSRQRPPVAAGRARADSASICSGSSCSQMACSAAGSSTAANALSIGVNTRPVIVDNRGPSAGSKCSVFEEHRSVLGAVDPCRIGGRPDERHRRQSKHPRVDSMIREDLHPLTTR